MEVFVVLPDRYQSSEPMRVFSTMDLARKYAQSLVRSTEKETKEGVISIHVTGNSCVYRVLVDGSGVVELN